MARSRERKRAGLGAGLLLATLSLVLCLAFLEIVYRLFDPFPYISQSEVNRTEHGNLSQYHPVLGWNGVPGGAAQLVTPYARVWLAHNRQGFRDVEHEGRDEKPALVFLGDSFTWGYEVEFDEMFVNRLRGRLPSYETYNLAHRGHGSDQQLLTFRLWLQKRRDAVSPRWVVLLFSENDVDDNNARIRSRKPKPQLEPDGEALVLVGTPVPEVAAWQQPSESSLAAESWTERLKRWVFRSHALHDIAFRLGTLRHSEQRRAKRDKLPKAGEPDLDRTFRILQQLRSDVEATGARLAIFFIPSRSEFKRAGRHRPYQQRLLEGCAERGIEAFDLAPALGRTWLRVYFRGGGHLTPRGHEVVADGIDEQLRALGL